MNIICKIVGHAPPVYEKKGWYSPGEEYGTLKNIRPDGTGRLHAEVWATCARCEEKFKVARIHLPSVDQPKKV